MTPFTQGDDRHPCKIMSGTAMLPWTTHRQLSLIIITMIQNKLRSVPDALAIIGLSYTEKLPAKPTMLGTAVRQGARVLVACVRGCPRNPGLLASHKQARGQRCSNPQL
jgi:hypothetical protein